MDFVKVEEELKNLSIVIGHKNDKKEEKKDDKKGKSQMKKKSKHKSSKS